MTRTPNIKFRPSLSASPVGLGRIQSTWSPHIEQEIIVPNSCQLIQRFGINLTRPEITFKRWTKYMCRSNLMLRNPTLNQDLRPGLSVSWVGLGWDKQKWMIQVSKHAEAEFDLFLTRLHSKGRFVSVYPWDVQFSLASVSSHRVIFHSFLSLPHIPLSGIGRNGWVAGYFMLDLGTGGWAGRIRVDGEGED